MTISIPKLSLVVLIGPSDSGKSTFASQHFWATKVLSSDACRAMVGDDENDQAVTKDAFEVLRFVDGRVAVGPGAGPVKTPPMRRRACLRHLAGPPRAASCNRRFLATWASISSKPSDRTIAAIGVFGSFDQNNPRSSLTS